MSENKFVHIVSGYMRSGTSMMMKCLDSGGMQTAFNKNKDQILNEKYQRGDYQPNPEGFYELTRKEFADSRFPQIYTGKLIKILHWRLEALPEYNYKIIFMIRDPKEIEVSYLKMFQRRPPFVLHKYDELLNEIFDKLENRPDMDIIKVQHRDVINNPVEIFSILKKKGWPIKNIGNAAASMNPELYRSREEDLKKVQKSIPGLRTDLPEVLKKNNN